MFFQSFLMDVVLVEPFLVRFCSVHHISHVDKAKWKGHMVLVVGLGLQVLNRVRSIEKMVGAARESVA